MRHRRISAITGIGAVIISLFIMALVQSPMTDTPSISETSSSSNSASSPTTDTDTSSAPTGAQRAHDVLQQLPVKGRAAKTGYTRSQFGDGWGETNGCSTRNIILNRDLRNIVLDSNCKVVSGTLDDPYTGTVISFTKDKSSAVQIDHVVALSNAWQTGAQLLTTAQRTQLANDPLELLAASGPENQAKGDGDAAIWLPKNKAFRCEYIARQIAVKKKYSLWVTSSEKDAMAAVLSTCDNQMVPQ